jgi:hypothetical protein
MKTAFISKKLKRIVRTIHLSGGPDFGSDEFLSLVFKNFCIERPKQRVWYSLGTWELF